MKAKRLIASSNGGTRRETFQEMRKHEANRLAVSLRIFRVLRQGRHARLFPDALNWVLIEQILVQTFNPVRVKVVVGTKRRTYLEENVGALDVDLTAEDLKRLDQLFPQDAAAGARYGEAMMTLISKAP